MAEGPANALLFVVLLLWGVPLSLLASVLSLHQFKVLYGLLANLSQKRYKNDIWRATRPCEITHSSQCLPSHGYHHSSVGKCCGCKTVGSFVSPRLAQI